MSIVTGAAIAGAAAAAAYLDGKYNIREDLAALNDLRRVNNTGARLANQNKRCCWYLYEEQVHKRPSDELCIWYRASPSNSPTTYTWAETYAQSCRYAQFLLSQGVRPGELVATYLQNSPEFMFSFLGNWAIGCAAAMINYNLAGESLIHCLKVADSKVVLVDEDSGCRQRIEEVRDRIENELGMRIVILDSGMRGHINSLEPLRPDNTFRDGVKGESPIFLFYTSGTTGMPKACAFQTERAYILGGPRLRTTGLVPGERWYDCMPLYHGTGCTIACGAMMTGLGLAIGRKFSVRNFWQDIVDSDARAFVYVGETARYLLAAPPTEWDTKHRLKAMYGNGMRPDVWLRFQQRFNIPVINEFFNSTEGVFSLLNIACGEHRAGSVGFHGGIRRLMLNEVYMPLRIDHATGGIWRDSLTGFAHRNSYEEGGEMVVQVDNEEAFCGYWNNPDATAKKFERDLFRKGDLFYRTGDALRRDKDGRWFFMDRLGDTFRWKSENVSTAEVSEVLGKFPGLVEANVYGVEIPGHDGRAGCSTVFVSPENRSSFDYTALLGHARKELPKYAVPVFLRIIKAPTPSHNNKQNKVPLRNEGIDPEKIRGGTAGNEDIIMWVRPDRDRYEVFDEAAWNELIAGKARL